jgi:ubiquinol-cytochrome c reductase cytochrome b subunit
MLVVFTAAFIILGVLGVKSPTPARTLLAQICTVIYFGFFITMPIWTSMEKTKSAPERVTMDGGMGFWKSVGAFFLIMALAIIPLKAVGSESEHACGTIECDAFEANMDDKASLQSGLNTYMNYCMGCHSLQYSRYIRVADDLGIPHDIMEANVIYDDANIGALMNNAMPKPLAKKWFGAAPPDLTLVARARNPEWLYTYLRTFYKDEKRPYGVNNKVFPAVGMPHVFLDLQGMQECAMGPVRAANGGIKRDPLTGEDILEAECGRLVVTQPGSQTPEEFDKTVYDLVNFLEYVAEPMQQERKRIGIYVMFFLAIFFVFAWLLNREYWKDVH